MIRKATYIIILIPVFLVFLYFGVRSIAVLAKGYTWAEMDWNSDGTTSLEEFFWSSDIGTREKIVGSEKCTEYFWYKDGLPVKIKCK